MILVKQVQRRSPLRSPRPLRFRRLGLYWADIAEPVSFHKTARQAEYNRNQVFSWPSMLRDKNLIPLSHQHQHVLALCVRIERASPIAERDLVAWQAEITQLVQTEIEFHFAAEETVLFPAAQIFQELQPLVDELLGEHKTLRNDFAAASQQKMSGENLLKFAQRLSTHIRKEERQLFERVQQLMNAEDLSTIGKRLEEALSPASQACSVPTETTRLRAKRSQ